MSGISDGTAKVGVIIPGSGINVDTYPSLEAAGIQLLRVAALRHTAGPTVKFVDKLRREILHDLNSIALEYMDGDEGTKVEQEVLLFTDYYQLPKEIVFDPDNGPDGAFITAHSEGQFSINTLATARWHGWRAAKGF